MYTIVEDAAGCVYVLKDGAHTDIPAAQDSYFVDTIEALVGLLNSAQTSSSAIAERINNGGQETV